MEYESKVIFDKNVIEFVTVAAEYCAFLEGASGKLRTDFIDTVQKLLPLLYLKASLLPKCELLDDEPLESYVTEEMYENLRETIAGILGDKDAYMEVFTPEMAFSDEPIGKTISEDLADIYQDLRDFIFLFQLGVNRTMNDALVTCKDNFASLWGQKLVNTLRALHDVKYNPERQDEETAGHAEGCDDDECDDGDCECHHHHD